MGDKIAAVVVTFNREIQLIECLNGIMNQRLLPTRLYIIDNHSNQKTYQALLEYDFISPQTILESNEDQIFEHEILVENTAGASLPVTYIRKAINDGGAGGFYSGMKSAYNDGYDWLWMMDDDGVPDEFQLKNLINSTGKNGFMFCNALLVNKNEPQLLAFDLKGYGKVSDIKEDDFIFDFINPFNGTLIHTSVIRKVGLVKKEMFIWGDEKEYMLRAKFAGFRLVTVLSAKHYHPKIKGIRRNVIPFVNAFKVVIKPDHMAHYYYRNIGFIEQNYANKKVQMSTRMGYMLYFLLRFKLKKYITFFRYYNLGMKDKFN